MSDCSDIQSLRILSRQVSSCNGPFARVTSLRGGNRFLWLLSHSRQTQTQVFSIRVGERFPALGWDGAWLRFRGEVRQTTLPSPPFRALALLNHSGDGTGGLERTGAVKRLAVWEPPGARGVVEVPAARHGSINPSASILLTVRLPKGHPAQMILVFILGDASGNQLTKSSTCSKETVWLLHCWVCGTPFAINIKRWSCQT